MVLVVALAWRLSPPTIITVATIVNVAEQYYWAAVGKALQRE